MTIPSGTSCNTRFSRHRITEKRPIARIRVFAILLVLIGVMGPAAFSRYPVFSSSLFALTPSSASWNPNVACAPATVTISDILGSSYPSQSLSGSRWQTSSGSGGIPNKRALNPPCTVNNIVGQAVPAFIQLNNVSLSNYFYETRDCSTSFNPVNRGGAAYPNGQTFCDSTGDIGGVGTNNGAFVHGEIDQDWMAAGYAGASTSYDNNNTIGKGHYPCTIPSPCSSTVSIDIQGFVFWDPEGQWEIHPLTAWRFAGLSASLSSNPQFPALGETVTFIGTAVGGTAPYSFTWNFGDGATAAGQTTTHSYSTEGAYTVTLIATDASGNNTSFSQVLEVAIPDFTIVADPNHLSILQGASASSTITLTSFNGLSGTVELGSTVFPSGPQPSLNPASVFLAAGGTSSSSLTVSMPAGTPPNDYSVTVKSSIGGKVRSTVVPISLLQSSSENRPPIITVPGPETIVQGTVLNFSVSASDSDPGELVTFSVSGMPSGAMFDPTIGNFTWKPGPGQVGTYRVNFTATDNGTPPLSDSGVVTVRVESSNGSCLFCKFPVLTNDTWLLVMGGMAVIVSSLTIMNLRAHSQLKRARQRVTRVEDRTR